MKPITDCKQQEQDYGQKKSACNVSYRHKRSGPKAGKINKVKQRFLIENIATQSSIIAVYSGSLNSFSQSNENFCMMLDAGCACLLYINLISSHIKMQRDKCPEFMLTVPI